MELATSRRHIDRGVARADSEDVQDTAHTLKLEMRHIKSTAAHVPFLDARVPLLTGLNLEIHAHFLLHLREEDQPFDAPPLPRCARGVPQAEASQVGTLKPRSRFKSIPYTNL